MKRNYRWVVLLPLLLAAFWLISRQKSIHIPAEDQLDRHPRAVKYSKHARCRMECRHIDESEVQEIIRDGKVNMAKSEPDSHPDPKYALEGVTHDGQRVRVVIATAPNNTMVVVTVIDLDTEWTCHCE